MPGWKLRIFVRVVIARMEAEQVSAETILEDYPALTIEEKQAILNEIIKSA